MGPGRDNSGSRYDDDDEDDYSEYRDDPRRDDDTGYVPDEQDPSDNDESDSEQTSGGGSTGTRGGTANDDDDSGDSGSSSSDGSDDHSEYEDDPRDDPDTGYVPDEQQTDDTGERPPDDDSQSEYEEDPRSDPDTGYVPEEQQTHETGERPPRETRQTYDDVVSEETRRNTTGGTPGDAQGTGQEDVGSGFVTEQGRVVDEAEAEQAAAERFASESDRYDRDQVRAEIDASGAVTFTLAESLTVDGQRVDEGTEIGSGMMPTTQEAAREMEQMAINETAATDPGDVRIVEDEGKLTTEFSYSGEEKVAAEQLGVSREDIDIRDGSIVPTSDEGRAAVVEHRGSGLAEEGDGYGGVRENASDLAEKSDGYGGEISAQDRALIELREEVGRPVDPDDVEIVEKDGATVARYEQGASQERFDVDWSMGLGGPGDEVERGLDTAIDTLTQIGRQAGGLAGGGAGQLYMQPLRGEEMDIDAAIEENREAQSWAARDFENIITGVTLLPAMAAETGKGVLEVNEWGIEAAEMYTDAALGDMDAEALSEFEEFQLDTEAAASETATQAVEGVQDNPRQFAGMAVGSLLGTGALFAATSGTRLGSAARWSIQPGEELATAGATRLAARSARGRRALESLPGERIDVEEITIAGARSVGKRVRNVDLDPDFTPSPRQQDLIEFGRPVGSAEATTGGESPTGSIEEGSLAGRTTGQRAQPSEASETGTTGAQSEPLGSPTEDILDASLGPTESGFVPEQETGLGPTGSRPADSGGVTEEMERIAGEVTGREQLGQAIEEFGVDVREFATAERGQTQLTGPSKSEVGPSIDEDRVTANLYQQAVASRTLRDFRNLEGGDYDGTRPAFETESQAETEAERLSQRAMDTEVRTESTGLPEVGRMESIGAQIGVDIGVDAAVIERQAPGVDVGEMAMAMAGPDIQADTRVDTRSQLQGASAEFGFEYESEFGMETEFEIGRLEMGFDMDPRPETRLDSKTFGDRPNDDIGGPVIDPDEFGIDYTNPVATSFDVLGIGQAGGESDIGGDVGIDAEKMGVTFEPTG
ncbi:hypothetical protein HSRCO_1621 [Halanaeroarchaeum sp. HSR-CO]|nr:hypothetical protein HSRCO_1621 [Halanaeroarchaeum sp. HSR-CO]